MTFKCSLTLQCFVILIEVGRGSECGEIFFSFLQVFKGRERWGGLDLIFHLDNIIAPLHSNVLLGKCCLCSIMNQTFSVFPPNDIL